MFKKITAAVGIALLVTAQAALAADRGTAQEAAALVKRAVAFQKANGTDKMLIEASNQKGQFIDRDLYLSVYDAHGKVLAHGSNARVIGIDASQIRDVDKKYFVKDMLTQSAHAASGWVDYKWVDPVSNKIEAKSTYFEKAGDVVIASGYYKQ